MTLKAVTLLCLMIKDRLTSVTISQEQLPRAVVPAGWAEEIQAGSGAGISSGIQASLGAPRLKARLAGTASASTLPFARSSKKQTTVW